MGLLSALAAWVYGGTAAERPTVVKALNSSTDPVSAGVQGVPWTDPSAGLELVNERVTESSRAQTQHDLDKTPYSLYARPAMVKPAFSVDSAVGDSTGAMGTVNTAGGMHTVIPHRPSANTLPKHVMPARQPFGVGADYRTAPAGALGAAIGAQQPDVPGARTMYRQVPPTDAANVPPAGIPVRGAWG